MVQSRATTVDEYLLEVDATWAPVVAELRARCRSILVGYDEVMAYGMPTYRLAGATEVAYARQVRHLSLYIAKQDVLDSHRDRCRGLSVGKGCIRYARPDQVEWDLVRSLLSATVASRESPC